MSAASADAPLCTRTWESWGEHECALSAGHSGPHRCCCNSTPDEGAMVR